MKFSVAIHTYNRADYLQETIDSVLAQSLPADEVIVVDDESTDNTECLVREYGDAVAYYRIPNAGCGGSRAAAVDLCSNEWIACSDDDDVWRPDHLECLASAVEVYPDAGFVFSNHTHLRDDTVDGYDKFADAPPGWWDSVVVSKSGGVSKLVDDAFRMFLTFQPAFASSFAFTRSVYDAADRPGEQYSRMNSEDADWVRRILLKTRTLAVSRVTVCKRVHDDNMSASYVKNQLGKARMLGDYLDEGIVPDKTVRATKAAISEALCHALEHSLWARDLNTALQIVSSPRLGTLPARIRAKLAMARALNWFKLGGE